MVILPSVFITIHLCIVLLLYSQYTDCYYIIILLFPHFTHSLGVFWLPQICISRSRIYRFADKVFGDDHSYCEEPEFPYLVILPLISIMLSSLLLLCSI